MSKKLFQTVLDLGKDVGTKEAIKQASHRFEISQEQVLKILLERMLESPDLESEFEPWRITILEALEAGTFQL